MSSALHSALDLCAPFDQMSTLPLPAQCLTKKTFPFLKLSPELRAIVYERLIQAGDLGILRVSKLINHEAIPHLSKVAILRISLGCPFTSQVTLALTAKVTLSGHLTLIAPAYIQHLDLRLKMVKSRGFPVNTNLIQLFSGNTIVRKSCRITIGYGLVSCFTYRLEESETYRVLATLTGFQILTLRLECCKDPEYEAAVLKRFGIAPENDFHGHSSHELRRNYDRISGYLGRTLGRAHFNDDFYKHRLMFRPTAYIAREQA